MRILFKLDIVQTLTACSEFPGYRKHGLNRKHLKLFNFECDGSDRQNVFSSNINFCKKLTFLPDFAMPGIVC